MKKSDLHKIVREAIKDVLNETSEQDVTTAKKVALDLKMKAADAEKKAADTEKQLANTEKATLGENEIDEMANQPINFELAPNVNAADFTGKKARIIATMQAVGEPIGKPELAKAMGYTMVNNKGEVVGKQNPINADFMALVEDGIIVLAGEQRAPRLNRPAAAPEAGEEEDGEGEIEGGIEGDMSDERVDAGFPNARVSDEEEPEEGEIEKTNVAAGGMSDDDYEAFMKYTDLEDRLSRVKSDILKAKRSRPSIGDISDQPSNELQNLRDLKIRLQAKLDDLLASSKYLQARKAKMNKKAEPEETSDEEQLDEWTKGRMQYYAGIKP
jgi:hypothetical protein